MALAVSIINFFMTLDSTLYAIAHFEMHDLASGETMVQL
jgi:hypothetical protein